jgi:Protein of unknown function (DUF3489)
MNVLSGGTLVAPRRTIQMIPSHKAADTSAATDSKPSRAKIRPAAKPSGNSRNTKAKPAKPCRTLRSGSKTAKILALLKRPGGATLPQLQKATGWQAHSVRGFLSGTLKKKMGLRVHSAKQPDGARSYRVRSK